METRTFLKTLIGSVGILFAAAAIAIATDLARSDGIPLIADAPYDIFSACRDSEATSAALMSSDVDVKKDTLVLYVDARAEEGFASEHAAGAINVPYSVLFGASPEALAQLKAAVAHTGASSVVVYGDFAPPDNPQAKTDLAKPLAAQLVEAGIAGVKHLTGGLDALKKKGVKTVQPGTTTP